MWKPVAKLWCRMKGGYLPPNMLHEYELKDNGPTELASFVIKEGLYKGTEYKVGEVRFEEVDNSMRVSFKTDIIKHPSWGIIKDTDQEFTLIAGILLDQVIKKNSYNLGQLLVS